MEKREPRVSREYQKGADRLHVFVVSLTGGEIDGVMYQFEEWLNNQERHDKRLTSGDKYQIRQRFQNRLADLEVDGWKKTGASGGGSEDQRFFDPSGR
jgi:hypothetical protein